MNQSRVIFVTGKGGAGKTTITAALGVRLAATTQRRTLIVETDTSGRLSSLFHLPRLPSTPTQLQRRLYATAVQPRVLLEEYFRSLLRVPLLSRRLLSSRTFNAVTAAAPGVAEFLLLQKVLQWTETKWAGRREFETVLIDCPATGHALKLLGTPRTIASLVPAGPIGSVARRALALLANHERTSVVLVALPEELAITETLETYDALVNDLALNVARPVLNRAFPRRFAHHDILALEETDDGADPLLHAARFQMGRRRETERHLARLRRGIPHPPITVPMVFEEQLGAAHLGHLGGLLSALV